MSMSQSTLSVLQWTSANLTEILIAAAIGTALVALLYGIRALLLRAAKKLSTGHDVAGVLANVVRKTRLWFIIALVVRVEQGYLHPPEDIAKTVSFLFIVAAALQVAIWARTLILGLIERRAAGTEGDPSTLASAFSIIRLLVSVAVFAIAAIVVLDNLGVNVTALIAGLGIGGIAIGLAAQGIFADLFAALSIIFDKPFGVGDVITYQGKEGPVTGTVERIGLKSTRIRALTGELRIIGNTQLLAQEVTNLADRRTFRFHLPISVTFQTDPTLAAGIPQLMQAEVERTGNRFVRAGFRGFGQSSIDFELFFDVDTDDGIAANQALQDIALGIVAELDKRGIGFAYPTQTSFTAAPDGKLVMPYPVVMPEEAGR
jgi:small-conductance mechanosensitive channel